MPKYNGSYILDKFRKTIDLFAFSQKDGRKFSEDSLAVLNTPPMLGKRDALYENAVTMLKEDIMTIDLSKRIKIYESVLSYLIAGIETGEHIFFGEHFKEKEKHETSPINHYLLLLADTVQAALTLAYHQMVMEIEEASISDFIGMRATTQVKITDKIFIESEKNIYESAKSLIEKAETAVDTYRDLLKRSMSKEDESRYRKAYMEFLLDKKNDIAPTN